MIYTLDWKWNKNDSIFSNKAKITLVGLSIDQLQVLKEFDANSTFSSSERSSVYQDYSDYE